MNTTWVLVTDKSYARFFSVNGPSSPLTEEDELSHEQSRLREQQLISDAPGSSSGNAGMGRHPMTKENQARHNEAQLFARAISDKLETLHQQGLRKLYVVSDPGFLGILRQAISPQTGDLIKKEIDKNLTGFAATDIRNHLPHYL
ncbi:MAG: host attachment protein [Pontibacterium sp.]